MSTVKFDTWTDSAGTRTYAPCTAWVNFNGTGTVAIRDSLNVSSVTDNATGDYTINFATAMANANYGVATAVYEGGVVFRGSTGATIKNATTTAIWGFTLQTRYGASSTADGADYDAEIVSALVMGGI